MTDNLRGAVAEVVMHFLSDAEIASLTKEQSVALADAVIRELDAMGIIHLSKVRHDE